MSDILSKLKRSIRVLIGGTWGLLAWGLSGAGMVAVIIWGIKAAAIPLLMLKAASWGLWSLGVFREAKTRRPADLPVPPNS